MASAASPIFALRFASSSVTRNNHHPMQMMISRSGKGRGNMGGFPFIRTLPLQICAAKAETVQQVSDIVRKQLALSPDIQVTAESTFVELGADSLDTVEIVMGLEEAFDITVEEENSDSIATIKDAADLIDKLVEKKAADS